MARRRERENSCDSAPRRLLFALSPLSPEELSRNVPACSGGTQGAGASERAQQTLKRTSKRGSAALRGSLRVPLFPPEGSGGSEFLSDNCFLKLQKAQPSEGSSREKAVLLYGDIPPKSFRSCSCWRRACVRCQWAICTAQALRKRCCIELEPLTLSRLSGCPVGSTRISGATWSHDIKTCTTKGHEYFLGIPSKP